MEIFFVFLFSYFSGSIPFGLILTKIFYKKDIRSLGSGNIGATNVLRTGNKFLAISTLVLDVLKGYIVILISTKFFQEYIQISCLLVFLAHLFPIWLKFKGGKGVATYLGILLGLSIEIGLLFIFTWIVISLIFKYSSLSSIISSLTVFIVTSVREKTLNVIDPNISNSPDLKLILFIFLILIVYTHRRNISNLKNKIEPKIKI